MHWRIIVLYCVLASFSACTVQEKNEEDLVVQGYRPVYGEKEDLNVGFESPRAINNPGRIYLYKQYLLINEFREGIHVYDNSNPAQPTALGFISLVGNTDMAIHNDVLYADAFGDLVALTASDFSTIKERSRLPLQEWYFGVPAPAGFYFECMDTDKGVVVSWKKSQLVNPSCYAIK